MGMSSRPVLMVGLGFLLTAIASGAMFETCAGTAQGFSTGKNATALYLDYKAMYTHCQYVLSNLEIVMPADDQSNFDFSFLREIREVKGYVLVYETSMDVLPLTGLRIIRGKQLLSENVLNEYKSSFSLLIKTNVKLRHLQLSSLREISNGDVGLIMNGVLSCHTFSSVDWQHLFSLESQTIYSRSVNNQSLTCSTADVCHSSCRTISATLTEEKHCWGPTASECQAVIRCHSSCDLNRNGSTAAHDVGRWARCFGPDENQCCHEECVGACVRETEYHCLACRNLQSQFNRCVPSCRMTASNLLDDLFCVPFCPSNYALFNESCVTSCPSGFTIETIGNDVLFCKKCSGSCPKVCFVNFDDQKNSFVNSDNIESLANCSRIVGNLVFPPDVFEPLLAFGGRRRDVTGNRTLELPDLALLDNVEIVSGYVYIDSRVPWLTNLEFLGNLEQIGRYSWYTGYSLVVTGQNIAHLGLRSLKRIRGGVNVTIGSNCYTNQAMLWFLVNMRSSVVVSGTKCNETLCDIQCKDRQCWGPGPLMCLKCTGYEAADSRTCVTNCSSRPGEYTPPHTRPGEGHKCSRCHEECLAESGCNGPTNRACIKCQNVRDGEYCRRSCPYHQYEDASRSCQACHPNCRNGCRGNSSLVNEAGCTDCYVALVSELPQSSEYKVTQCLDANVSLTLVCPAMHFSSDTVRPPLPGHIDTPQFCIPCDSHCESCIFYGSDKCLTCNHVELYSNLNEDGNTVTCATSCPEMHYEKILPAQQSGGSRPRRICSKCSQLCLDGCSGPSAAECKSCNRKRLYTSEMDIFTCVEKCPDDAKYSRKGEDDQDVCSSADPEAELRERAEKRIRHTIVGTVVGCFLLMLGVAIAIACLWCRRVMREKSRLYEAEMMGGALGTEPLELTDAPPDLSRLRLVKESEIRRGCMIGSGAFGTVYKGLWLPEGEGITLPVAIKVLQEGTTPEQSRALLEEARIMATAMHPCCVRLVAVCLTSPMMLLTQLIPNGCLLDYVHKNKADIGSKSLLDWCTQIAMGMEYLEGRGIVHRDLAARNVLVQDSDRVKITDFGLAKVLEYDSDKYEATDGKMPIKWMALESLMDRIYTHKTDVWSYGVTLWELFTYGQRPYDGVRAYDMLQLLERGERLNQPTMCTIDVYMILVKCWMSDPKSRPAFADLVNDFGRMSKDPGRYLVIAGDRLMKLNKFLHTAQDLLEQDADLAAAVAEKGSKVMDLDDFLKPATAVCATPDARRTSAQGRFVMDRTRGVKCLRTKPTVNKVPGMRSASLMSSSNGTTSYEEINESTAAEQQPFLLAAGEAGYLQLQPSVSIEDYLNPKTTRDQYLDVIPEDDLVIAKAHQQLFSPVLCENGYLQLQPSTPIEDYLNPSMTSNLYVDVIPEYDPGFAKDKRNPSSPNDTSADGDEATVGKVRAAPSSRTVTGLPRSCAAAADSSNPTRHINISNSECYLSTESATLPMAEPAADGLASTVPA